MKNLVQPGGAINVSAFPYQRNSGDGVLVGAALFGVSVDTVSSGAAGVIWTEGVYDITKATTVAGAIGARMFWDNTAKALTTVSTGGTLAVGVVVDTAAGTTDTTVRVKLGGGLPINT